MRPLIVAKKDFRDAIRSRTLWALTALFVIFTAGMAYLFTLIQNSGAPGQGEQAALEALDLVFFLVGPAALLVPIVGLVITHKSIAGEVESGSAKVLLSAPFTRRDVVVGKVLGRAGVFFAALLVGFLVAAVFIAVLYDQFDLASYVAFVVLTLLFGLTYVAIGVGISALTTSGSRAIVYAVGFFIVFEVVWDFLPNLTWFALNGSFSPPRNPETFALDAPVWYFFLQRLSPSSSYSTAVNGLIGDSTLGIAASFGGEVPLVLSGGAAIVLLLLWTALPVALGYLRFRDIDLS